jgi:hypothetical protein
MVRRSRRRVRIVRLATVIALGTGLFAAVAGPSSAQVTSVTGSAFGFFANVGLFGGPPSPRGPEPTVTLPPGGSATPVTATAPTGTAVYGPATIFESGTLNVSTQGTTGPVGDQLRFG